MVVYLETLRFLMITTHFPPYHLGGDAVFVDYLSRELSRRGHEVHVLCNPAVYGLVRKPVSVQKADSPIDSIHWHPYESRAGRARALATLVLGMDGGAVQKAENLVKSERPEVVHWHNTRGFICRPLRWGNEVSLYTSHDYGIVCPRSNLLKPNLEVCSDPKFCTVCCMRWGKPPLLWRTQSGRVVRFPDKTKILAPSRFMANILADDGVRTDHVLRNFVPDPGSPRWDEPDSGNSIVYLGMLEIHKGLRTLIKAFLRSMNRHGYTLDIVGDGSLGSELRQMISSAGAGDRIFLHGFLSREKAELLRSKAAFQVVPSEWYENCPLTILEALASGVPILSSDAGGIPEITEPESGSRLFKCGDVDALAEALTELWNERGHLVSRRKKAREYYERQFRPDLHLSEYLRIINCSR